MPKNKLIDCITFFDNNLMFELRFNILKDFMDFFVVCESKYDHRNNKKKLNLIQTREFLIKTWVVEQYWILVVTQHL